MGGMPTLGLRAFGGGMPTPALPMRRPSATLAWAWHSAPKTHPTGRIRAATYDLGNRCRTGNGTKHGIKVVFPIDRHIHFLAIGANRIFVPLSRSPALCTWLKRKGMIDVKTAFSELFLCETQGKCYDAAVSWPKTVSFRMKHIAFEGRRTTMRSSSSPASFGNIFSKEERLCDCSASLC